MRTRESNSSRSSSTNPLAQRLQMPAHQRKGDLRSLRQLPGPTWSLAQKIHDAPAIRVRQRGESAVDFVNGAHVSGLNLKPVASSISANVVSLTGCANVQ